jgi:hypothetical protein
MAKGQKRSTREQKKPKTSDKKKKPATAASVSSVMPSSKKPSAV